MHPKFQYLLFWESSTASMQGTVSLRSLHGKFLSAQPDGRAEWNRDIASEWEYFYLEKRQGGKITLKGAHGMYVSAQPDGSVQINRKAAPQGGWEEFTVEDRGNSFVCLKSCHGKYLSALDKMAQHNGTGIMRHLEAGKTSSSWSRAIQAKELYMYPNRSKLWKTHSVNRLR